MVIVIATHRWIDGLLFHVSASDPLIIGASAGVLLFVGIAASLIPTGRALLKNPAEVLRAE
jgi:ABC-type lipoprotein release transport system permease subunit